MESPNAPLLRWAASTRRRHRLGGAWLRTVAPLLPERPAPREPVFVLGSPRSGTTMLVNLLDASPRLASLGRGSQFLWEMFHAREGILAGSHAISPSDIAPNERRALTWAIDRLTGPDLRYLDKFPRNVLRAEYLHALFPDASFVYIRRDGRSVVSSLMTGWRTASKFGHGTRLAEPVRIEGYEGDVWRFLLPPGWEAYASTGRRLEEVCAFQWVAANEAVLRARDAIAPRRWFEVSYEELVDEPVPTTERMFSALDLPVDEPVRRWAAELDQHVSTTAVSAPAHDKWRREHPAEVERVLPTLEPMLRRLGYLDASSA